MDGPRVAAAAATAREPFDLTFRLTADDYRGFLRKARWSAAERAMMLLPAVAAAALGVLAGVLVAFAADTADAIPLAVAAIVGGAVVYGVYRLVLLPSYDRSRFAGQPLAVGETKLVVDTRGIAANMGDIVLALPWLSVQRVVETDAHIFLLFARLAAVIVPRRAFASGEEFRRFVTFARAMAGGRR